MVKKSVTATIATSFLISAMTRKSDLRDSDFVASSTVEKTTPAGSQLISMELADTAREMLTVRSTLAEELGLTRASTLERKPDRTTGTTERRLRAAISSVIAEFERAVSYHETQDQSGMRVPYHGDFRSVGPSTVDQMRRWIRDLNDALDDKWPLLEEEMTALYQKP